MSSSSSSKDTARRKKQKDQIHFVNARPSSETEKLKIQRMVRAHVGKWISDQTRDRTPGGSAAGGEESGENSLQAQMQVQMQMQGLGESERAAVLEECEELSRSEESTTDAGSSSHSSPPLEANGGGKGAEQKVVAIRSLSNTPGDSQQRSTPTSHGIVHDRHAPSRAPSHAPSRAPSRAPNAPDHSQAFVSSRPESIDRTGSSGWDPFHTYPSHYPPEFINVLERYSLSIIWPFLTPDSPSGSGIVANSTWFPLSLTDSTLFTAFLFSSLSHQYVRWRNHAIPDGAFKPRDLRTLQMVEIETIKLVNNAVQDPARAASDAVLLSVLCMAHNTAYNTQRQHPSTPFTAPLQHLQWLDVFGSLPPNLVHVQGLIQMVLLRGGVHNIELPGLPSTLSFSDILTASAYLTRPAFAWMPLEKSRRGSTLQALLGFRPLDIEHVFGRFRDIGFTPAMAEAFQAARVYTRIAEEYIQGSLTKPDLTLIIDQRNLVHYALLCLPSSNELPTLSHQTVYEASRLTALIYGVGVIFPLPSGSTPLPELSRRLQTVLQLPTLPSMWASPEGSVILLWILTMGAIAAEAFPERRTWFVSALSHTARQNRISSWSELRNTVASVLWFGAACDEPGRRVWIEMEQFVIGV